jgi:colanic acid/amylovoran biosynthesis glycosyltransferase
MSRFPKLTETFVLYEMLAAEAAGTEIEVYPLKFQREAVMHEEARALTARAHFTPLLSPPILWANLLSFGRRPRLYLSTLAVLLRRNWGSRRYFTGALGLFPKAVYMAARMRSDGITHVHAHFASHPAATAFVVHRLTGIPYSFTAHGSDLHRDRHMLSEKVAAAAFVVCISNYNKEVVLAECGGEAGAKVAVIHCGVDTAVFHPNGEDGRRLGEERGGEGPSGEHRETFKILCIGTLHPVKGQSVLIEACRKLRESGVAITCHLVGDGPDRAALVRQARAAGLEGVVHFHGHLTRPRVAELLQQADIVAAPSVPTRDGRREGIPVALMEAMASGVPVVASRLSGIPELVEDERTGLLVPPGDAAELARAIARLQAGPALRSHLAAAGRTRVMKDFDLHANARLLLEHVQHARCTSSVESAELV